MLLLALATGGRLWFPAQASGQCSVSNWTACTAAIEDWQVPIAGASPAYVVNGPDGALWTTSPGNDSVYRFSATDGALLSMFSIPDNNGHSNGNDLAVGPDGNVWVTVGAPTPPTNYNGSTNNAIVRITPSGVETPYCLSAGATVVQGREGPSCQGLSSGTIVAPTQIVAGSSTDQNSMWFGTNSGGTLIGRISTTTGQSSTYSFPSIATGVFVVSMAQGPSITGTPNSDIWTATYGGATTNSIYEFSVSPSGPTLAQTIALPTGWHPSGMTPGAVDSITGKQKGVWVADNSLNRVGFAGYDGSFTPWNIVAIDPDPANDDASATANGTSTTSPQGVALDSGGNVWTACINIHSICQLDPSTGNVTPWRLPGGIMRPYTVMYGADHNIWYTSVDTSRIGRIDLNPATPPSAGSSPFLMSGQFQYNSYTNNTPILLPGQPLGVTASQGTMEVTMREADRLQRVPLDLQYTAPGTTNPVTGPPGAGSEVTETSTLTQAAQAANPWRTIECGGGCQPSLIQGNIAPGSQEWLTQNNDTIDMVVPAPNPNVGDIWGDSFTLTGSTACCLTAQGIIYLSGPSGITATPTGTVWFTEFMSSHIALASPGMSVLELPTPTPNSEPFAITSTADSVLWFTEARVSQIGSYNPVTSQFAEYPLPIGSQPWGITTGADGAVWFTLRNANAIGRIDPTTHAISTWTLPTANAQPTAIVAAADGRLYITEYLTGKLARLQVAAGTPTWTEWTLPYGNRSFPWWVAPAPDGNIWVTLPYRNQVARLTPP